MTGYSALVALQIVPVGPDTAEQWREIHNRIIPPHQLTADEVRERLGRNRLTLAYADGRLVGNAMIRPPQPDSATATVIVRILPGHRRRGFGSEYLTAMLAQARALPAERIETVVLAANGDGLAFASRRGFVEFDRYDVDGAEYVELYLAA